MLLSFSVRANLKHICDQTVGSDTIQVLHGLKAISMAWVILGHTCIVAFKYSGKKVEFICINTFTTFVHIFNLI